MRRMKGQHGSFRHDSNYTTRCVSVAFAQNVNTQTILGIQKKKIINAVCTIDPTYEHLFNGAFKYIYISVLLN